MPPNILILEYKTKTTSLLKGLMFASKKKICPVCKRQKEEICVVCFYDFAVKKSELEKKLINEELKILITEAVISAFINFNRFLNATKPSKKNSN